MNDMPLSLKLKKAREYLERPGRILPDPDRAADLAQRARDLGEQIETADDRITIGLIGGTGVGKSTLINALAGEPISRSAEVRPTTNHLVLYRHRDNPFSLDDREEVSTHEAEALKRICLADFPDFDSIEPHHRELLSRHFDRLDLLLWVVDPVKYADQALYNWLSLAPQARVNSLFILNKTDEFSARYGREAERISAEVRQDFEKKLLEYAGLDEPVILPLSALSALAGPDGRHSPGFTALTDILSDLSEKKRRLSIKRMNLNAMAEALLREIGRSADPERTRAGLEGAAEFTDRLEKELAAAVASVGESLTTVLLRSWSRRLTLGARERAPWPLDFFLFIRDRLSGLVIRRPAEPGADESRAAAPLPEPDTSLMNRRLDSWRAESRAVFGPSMAAAGKGWRDLLQSLPPPGDLPLSQALTDAGMKASRDLQKRFKWRVRHHVAPLVVSAYPFIPMLIGLLTDLLAGEAASTRQTVQIVVGWRDVFPVLGAVVGLYALQTVYYSYSLHKAAAKEIGRLARQWEKDMGRAVQERVLAPIRSFLQQAGEELRYMDALLADLPPEDSGQPAALPRPEG